MATSYRHALRYRQILGVLITHGLDGFVAPLDIHDLHLWDRLRFGRVPDATPYPGLPPTSASLGGPRQRARHVRLALEELGPTFVKLGQILSTRSDLLPPEYIAELILLQDRAPSVSFSMVATIIESELGMSLPEAFAEIALVPLASASLGQVHAATLHDGTEVVIKVQRPGVTRVIERDLAILRDLARSATGRFRIASQLDLPSLVDEFAMMIRAELDYLAEGRNAEHFARLFADVPSVRIPKVFWSHTRERILTLERFEGTRIDHVEELPLVGRGRQELAIQIAGLFMREVLDEGFFHADPHPGNLLVLPNGAIGRLDFGMVGFIDRKMRERLMLLLLGAVERDPARVVDQLELMGATGLEISRPSLERDIGRLLAQYLGRPLAEIRITRLIQDITAITRRHGIRVPPQLAILLKTILMYEALGRQLDPAFDAIVVVEPYLRQSVHKLYSPSYWVQRFKHQPLELLLFGSEIPGQLQRLVTRLERNEFTVRVHHNNLPEALAAFDSMLRRLSLVILTSALAIGLSILYQATTPSIHRWPGRAFLLGFIVTSFLSLLSFMSLWRGRRQTFR